MNAHGRSPLIERGGRVASVPVLAWALTFALVAGLPALTIAHPLRSAAHGIPHGAESPIRAPGIASAEWGLLAALALCALGLMSARRFVKRAAVLSLAMTLAAFALEAAVHSVHHLSDADAAARCVVLSASQHVDGAGLELPVVAAPVLAPHAMLSDGVESAPRPERFRVDAGRAPPSPSV